MALNCQPIIALPSIGPEVELSAGHIREFHICYRSINLQYLFYFSIGRIDFQTLMPLMVEGGRVACLRGLVRRPAARGDSNKDIGPMGACP